MRGLLVVNGCSQWLSCVCRGSQYGDVADECADAYFWYGKALLEVSRQEGGILGDAVPGGSNLQTTCTHSATAVFTL